MVRLNPSSFARDDGHGATGLRLRLRNSADRLLRRFRPGMEQRRRAGQFEQMLGLRFFQSGALDYRIPAVLHAERDRPE